MLNNAIFNFEKMSFIFYFKNAFPVIFGRAVCCSSCCFIKKGKEREGKEREGKERGREGQGKERNGKERKGGKGEGRKETYCKKYIAKQMLQKIYCKKNKLQNMA